MKAKIVKIKEFKKVAFYTILIEGSSTDEYSDFLARMNNSAYKGELEEILRFIIRIGDEFGAKPNLFRHERQAEALPPKNHSFIAPQRNQREYGIRLYCIRLTEQIVLLVNGGVKTNNNPEKCKNCSPHFKLANLLSSKLNQAISPDKTMVLYEKEIILDDFFELDI